MVKAQIAGPTPKVSDSLGLRQSPRTGISPSLPGEADAVGPGATLGEPLI